MLLLLQGSCIVSATSVDEVAKLTASDAAADDRFSYSVSVDGDTIVVGAPDDDDSGSRSGSAYVYTRSGTTWTEQKLTASDAASDDLFGWSVSVDGDTIVVGAYSDDEDGVNSGSAYVFTRSGTTWTEQQKLNASDAAENDQFGYSVSVDGDTIVVGAIWDDDCGSKSGSAYVFTRSGTTWTEQQKLTASDGAAEDVFGWSVSVDGDTIIVGAPFDDDDGDYSGSAYIFTRFGTTWTEQQKLTASDGDAFDEFGYSVSVDGDTIVVGAFGDDDSGSRSGSVYVFTGSDGTWSQQQKLTASDGASFDYFGYSVSVEGDKIVAGAPFDDDSGSKSGSVYLFASSDTNWIEQQKLTASDGAANDEFGYSVSVDGNTIVVSAYGDDDDGSYSGSAYVFGSLVIVVDIDIKPTGDRNSINLESKGKVPVAILGSDTFDATTVDPLTVELAGAPVIIKKKGKPMSSIEDVNKDGYPDLVVHVSTVDLQLEEGDTEAELIGQTFDGIPIKGTDAVNIVPGT